MLRYGIEVTDTTGQNPKVVAMTDAAETVRLVQRVPLDAVVFTTPFGIYWNWDGGVLTVWVPQDNN